MKKNKTKEIWAPARYIRLDGSVLDFTGYEVSSLGSVRSLNYNKTGKVRILCPHTFECKDGSICYKVGLYKDNKRRDILVHRLVLSSFNPEGFRHGPIVNHKTERTSTSCINKLSNLEWATQQQNSNTEHCRKAKSKAFTNRKDQSKRVHVTDLTTSEAIVYPSAMEAGRALGINPKLVSTIILQHKGFYKKLNLRFEYIK